MSATWLGKIFAARTTKSFNIMDKKEKINIDDEQVKRLKKTLPTQIKKMKKKRKKKILWQKLSKR